MLFLTGDTHGLWGLTERLRNIKNALSENDYLVILGDFGCIWNIEDNKIQKELKMLENISSNIDYKILFLDGNHENFKRLNEFPEEEWNGGRIHVISDKIYHLMRGYVFNIDNKNILVCGGGTSIDKYFRTQDVSWWEEENITDNDINRIKESLIPYNNQVDYIFTHCAPELYAKKVLKKNGQTYYKDQNCVLLDSIRKTVKRKKWFFGHYHFNDTNESKYMCLYEKIHILV